MSRNKYVSTNTYSSTYTRIACDISQKEIKNEIVSAVNYLSLTIIVIIHACFENSEYKRH